MRARSLFLVGLVTVLLLAGCLDHAAVGGGAKSHRGAAGGLRPALQIPDGWSELPLADEQGHNHADHAMHLNMSTPNFEVLGYNPLITDYHGRTAGGYLCGDANEKDGRRLAIVHSFTTDVAFIISDVTDAARPQKIGEFVMANTHVYDLALTQDQKTVLLATSPGTNNLGPDPSAATPQVMFRDACTGQERPVKGPEQGLPFASGVVVVDVTNPRVPAIVDFRFFPVSGGHSVSTKDVGGRPLVLVSVPNGGLPLPPGLPAVPPPTRIHSYYVFAELQESATGRKLVPLSIYHYAGIDGPVPGTKIFAELHDGTMQKHPITGKMLAYLAYGTTGLVILDIEDPKNPKFVSHWDHWSEFGEAGVGGHFQHETLPIEGTWDGRHYTFMGEECVSHPTKSPTCLVSAFDTTDPSQPKLVGAWTLPHDVQWTAGLQFSLHYLALVNRTLFVTVYHAGLWAVDVSRLGTGPFSLASVGVFMPPNQSPKPARNVPYSPRVNDAIAFRDGTLLVYDAYTGLYLVRFDDQNLAPAPEPWPLGKKPAS
jgi:hypothetical protein